jgi:hypothetical protein
MGLMEDLCSVVGGFVAGLLALLGTCAVVLAIGWCVWGEIQADEQAAYERKCDAALGHWQGNTCIDMFGYRISR